MPRAWSTESRTSEDPVTGAMVRQLTHHLGHSNHLYFTQNGWWDDGRQLLFQSDRDNRCNLFTVALQSGQVTQITDESLPVNFQSMCVIAPRREGYVWRGPELLAIELDTGEQRVLYTAPDDKGRGNLNPTADGKYVCSCLRDHVPFESELDLGHGYIGFRELFEAHPHCQVIRIDVDGGRMEVVHEEDNWLTHINTSPVHPNLLTFCHEGPWHLVAQRMWGLDMRDGRTWAIRPQTEDEALGHEYWFADGETLGYHGRTSDSKFYGAIKYDNTNHVEAPFPDDSHHFYSQDLNLIVGDGSERPSTPYVLLWRYLAEENRFTEPRVVCRHRCSRHIQRSHVHPRFSDDMQQIVYTSDTSGYANVYLVDMPDFDRLPTLEAVRDRTGTGARQLGSNRPTGQGAAKASWF